MENNQNEEVVNKEKPMKTEIKLTIPKHKIKGERIGQLIYNAIKIHWIKKKGVLTDNQIADCLFTYENDELQKIIDEYLAN